MKLLNSIGTLSALLVMGSAVTAATFTPAPYVGAEIQNRRMPLYSGYGDDLYRKAKAQGSLFLGVGLDENWAIEAGYSYSKNKSKTVNVPEGSLHLGAPAVAGFKEKPTQEIRGPHVSLVGTLPFKSFYDLQAIGIVGVSRLRVKFVQLQSQEGMIASEVMEMKKTKNILRLGLGLQKMISEQLGIRATVIHENTKKLGYLSAPAPLTEKARLKNSLTYGLGFFVKF